MNMEMESPAPTLVPDETRLVFSEKASPIFAQPENKMISPIIKHQIDDIQKTKNIGKKEKSKKNKRNNKDAWLPNFCTCCGDRKETLDLPVKNGKITNKKHGD